MKILVISDTHHYLENAREVLQRIGDKIDMVFHLGDHDKDAIALKKEFSHLPFEYVRGNNDYSNTPDHVMIHINRRKLLLTHGHKQNVYFNYNHICYWAQEKGADAVLFGHTHRPAYEQSNVLLLNPGSISLPRSHSGATFAILDISDEGRMEASILSYQKNGAFIRLHHHQY